MNYMDENQKEKVWKLLKSTTYCSISTCSNGQPHSTMAQPSITPKWEFIILSKTATKKVKNLQNNNQVWITIDYTGLIKRPKVIYLKGTAELEQLNEKTFNEFLSYHGWITKKILKKLTKEFSNSTRIKVIPNKIITIGIFDKPEKIVSFLISDEQNQ